MIACDLSFEYFLFACFSVSTPLYIIVLWVLIRAPSSDKMLGTPFFRIVISTGIVDIFVAVMTYTSTKFRLWGWAYSFYAKVDPVPRYLSWIGYSTTYSQCIGTVLIAINRYTALAMPLRHEAIWSAKNVLICIAAQWLIPAAVTSVGAIFGLADFTFYLVPDDGIINGTNFTGLLPFPVILAPRDERAEQTSTMFQDLAVLSWGATAVVVLIIYLRLFSIMQRVVQNARINQQQQSTPALSREFRLLAYGVVVVVIQGSAALLGTLLKYYGFNTWYRPTAAMLDFNCYSNPYFLLALSTPLRDRFLAFIKFSTIHKGAPINLATQERVTRRNPGATTAYLN